MKKTGFIAGVLLSTLLLVILYNIWSLPFEFLAKKVILPTSNVIGDLANRALSPIRFLGEINGLYEKNKQLEGENLSLKAQIVSEKEQENLCTQILQEQKVSVQQKTIFARIISRAPQNFNRYIVVDRGTVDGVGENDAVMSNGYLIGQIRTVEEKSSEVVLITNHSYMTPAMLDRSRENGMVQGSLEGLVITDIPSWIDIANGEKVLTSGLGGDLPKGLLIGEVVESDNNSGLFQSVEVSSPFILSKTEGVTILINEQ